MACNECYQFSIASALMDGVADTGIPFRELLTHGNHGLGTFRFMNGEMILIDDEVYRMKDDAFVSRVDLDGDEITPFAQVTRFEATTSTRATISSKDALLDVTHALLPGSRNHFIAIRIHGTFRSMTVRTGNGQQTPGESLVDIAKRQVVHTLEKVTGTLVGFESPAYMHGIGVGGEHMHFITDDRTRGGHLLGLQSDGEVDVQVAPLNKFHLDLPTSEEFNNAKLVNDDLKLKAAEG